MKKKAFYTTPLSHAQRALWYIHLQAPQSAAYIGAFTARIHSFVDVTALRDTFQALVNRHATLRTTFTVEQGEAVQVVHEQQVVDFAQIDAAAWGEDELSERVKRAYEQPFDLEDGPLMRVRLFTRTSEQHVLLIAVHHIIFDGWSMWRLLEEWRDLYPAFVSGENEIIDEQMSGLPAIRHSYADYVAWQSEMLQRKGQRLWANWQKLLAAEEDDALSPLTLPTDRPRPPVQTYNGASYLFRLPAELSRRIQVLAGNERATVYMTLLSAFQVLLHRYTGQEKIRVGSATAGTRSVLPEFADLAGYLTNMIVVPGDLSANPTFKSFLAQMRETAFRAQMLQAYPFALLVQNLPLHRDPSYPPLVQVVFGLHSPPKGLEEFTVTVPDEHDGKDHRKDGHRVEWGALQLSPFAMPQQEGQFDLTLDMEEGRDSLVATFKYNTDLFDASTIQRMAGHFQTLLEGIVANPEQRISDLPLLTADERHQLSGPHPPPPSPNSGRGGVSHQSIHHLFEQHAEHTPDAMALVYGEQRLTYRQLNEQANQLAHCLQSFGVGPESVVGLCVERSIEMVVGILGILKAGGAYLPLDPAYPADRLAFMVEDAKPKVLLTQAELRPDLPDAAHVLCLDADWERVIESYALDTPPCDAKAGSENLAYIIYTSGSTGRPKGVLVTHGNVIRLFQSTEQWFHFNQEDVWTLFHSYAFDFSVWEIWGALIYGGRLVVVPYLISREPEAFYQLLAQEGVTVLNQTPSAFRQLMRAEETLGVSKQLALRYIIFGGEALDLASLRPWFERHGDRQAQLVNMYGITETTVHVTYRPLSEADVNRPGSVIGGPIPDLQLYILDPHQQLVPIGVPGELYVGGAGVSRGYLNRPELTAERFIEHSFGRLYRTGDLARYLADGDVEYLGRIDNQVKIRGFRIELGEIESVLAQHPAVRESVVLVQTEAQPNQEAHQYLVGYVILHPEQPLTTSALRRDLLEQLPDYMVPARFVTLDAFPLTQNGKLDRKALLAISASMEQSTPGSDSHALRVAPQTAIEKTLANIWAEVLHQKQIGIYDNFFDLGGDSIVSIQVLAKAKEAGLDFSLAQLFQKQTIHALAQELGTGEATPQTAPFSLLSDADRLRVSALDQDIQNIEDAYPLAALQLGMIYHSSIELTSAVYHDMIRRQIRGPFVLAPFRDALQEVIDRHPILRTSFALGGFTEPLQLVHRHVEMPLTVADIRHHSAEEQERILNAWFDAEKQRGFDWQQAPLLRIQVHRYADNQFSLGLSFHHAILDGWSVATLLTELLQRYAIRLGFAVSLPTITPEHTYRDFIALERSILQSEAHRTFWQERLADATYLSLPRLSQLIPTKPTDKEGMWHISIQPTLCEGLKNLAHRASVPLKSVLLAAHLRVMSALSNQSDVLTGMLTNGRPEEAGGERILGLFLNTLPYRLQLNGGTWFELVQQVFQAEQEMIGFRRYPLPEIQKLMGGHALFETGFSFIHFHVYQDAAKIEGLEILEEHVFEHTNYTLGAICARDPLSDQIHITLNYDASALSRGQIEQIGQFYRRTLAAMVRQPSADYTAFSLLSDTERHQMLVEWNKIKIIERDKTTTDDAPEMCVHQIFEQQVTLTPNARAVVFHHKGTSQENGDAPADGAVSASYSASLSYHELNARANQLAHYLQSIGVAPDTLVCLCLERSIDIVVGILAILKAGGAYLPLDPTYPAERLAFMVDDAAPLVILTASRSNLLSSLPHASHGAQVISLDAESDPPSQSFLPSRTQDQDKRWTGASHATANPSNSVTTDNLAYVIYTSGSTGKPKGVLVTHRGIPNLAQTQIRAFGVTSESRVLQFASPNFDASVSELMMALCVGAELHLAPRHSLLPGPGFVRLLEEQAITHVTLPPSLLARLPEAALPALEGLIVAGEACPPNLVAKWARGRRVFNAYGPTEATVCATIAEIKHSDTIGMKSVPIGRPIDNVQVYILDVHGQPVPVGTPGELYIGGIGLAKGYLNRPQLTAEKFIANPLLNESDNESDLTAHAPVLYKTGDSVRWRPDGQIEFLGRIDNQVKVRGFRIELDEIRAVVNQHAALQDSAVIVRENEGGEKYITAYVVPRPQETVASGIELWPSVTGFDVLDDLMYYAMTHDEKRLNSYKVALRQAVPGKTVLEIGTGKDAIVAIFCAQVGAKKVYAIDIDEKVCRAAQARIEALGLTDTIEVIHGDATQITLPEQVDVCVSEIIGSIGGSEGAIPILNSAHRFLKPDGVMIPTRSVSKIVAVTLPDEVRLNPTFSQQAAHYTQKIFEQVGYPFDLRLCIRQFPLENRLSSEDIFENLEFSQWINPEECHHIQLTIEKDGWLDGFLVWLNLHTSENEVMNVLEGDYSLLPVYLPTFEPRVAVSQGDLIHAQCIRTLAENQLNPDYVLKGRLVKTDGSEIEFGHESYHYRKRYKQTPFYQRLFAQGIPVTPVASEEHAQAKQEIIASVRKFLQQRLPEYMIPTHLMELTALPISPNGKLDRRLLPDPIKQMHSQAQRVIALPQSEIERQIASVWQEVLKLEQVGIHDTFFDLGGQSLLMMDVYTKLQEKWQFTLEITDLFEHPTIHALAQYITQQKNKKATTPEQKPSNSRRQRRDRRRERREKRKKRKKKS